MAIHEGMNRFNIDYLLFISRSERAVEAPPALPVGLLYVEQAEFNSAECRPPRVYPLPGQVIVGYQIVEPDPSGCSCDLKLEVPTVLAARRRLHQGTLGLGPTSPAE